MRRREVLVGAPGSEKKKKTIKMRGKEKLKVRKKKERNVMLMY